MAGDINWKQKYTELKQKYMNSVDMAFRLGFEDGQKQASQDNAMQQQQQAQDQMTAAAGAPPGGGAGGPPGAGGPKPPGGEAPEAAQPGDQQSAAMPGGATPNEAPKPAVPMAESEHPDGTELDQHIAKLESMIKGELTTDDLQKSVDAIRQFRKSQLQTIELKKSQEAISGIAKALHKPAFKLGVQAQHNMSSNAKAAVSMQEKIVGDIMQKWEQEENKAGKGILAQLGIEGLTKE
jgi:hypothetical protein